MDVQNLENSVSSPLFNETISGNQKADAGKSISSTYYWGHPPSPGRGINQDTLPHFLPPDFLKLLHTQRVSPPSPAGEGGAEKLPVDREGWGGLERPQGRAPSPVSLEAGLEEEGQSALHLKGQAPDLNRRIQNTEFWGRKKKKSKWKEEESFDPG